MISFSQKTDADSKSNELIHIHILLNKIYGTSKLVKDTYITCVCACFEHIKLKLNCPRFLPVQFWIFLKDQCSSKIFSIYKYQSKHGIYSDIKPTMNFPLYFTKILLKEKQLEKRPNSKFNRIWNSLNCHYLLRSINFLTEIDVSNQRLRKRLCMHCLCINDCCDFEFRFQYTVAILPFCDASKHSNRSYRQKPFYLIENCEKWQILYST